MDNWLMNLSFIVCGVVNVEIGSGDKLVFPSDAQRKAWVVSAVNSRVVKYFDENGSYAQMPVRHLEELVQSGQVKVVHSESAF